MFKFITQRRRGTAIIETKKGILIAANRSKVFLLPGGAASRKESRMQAAIREVKEETGLEPYFAMALFRLEGRTHSFKHITDFHTVYYIKAKGEARPTQEIKYLDWYKAGKDIQLSQTTKRILDQYVEYKKKNKVLFKELEQF